MIKANPTMFKYFPFSFDTFNRTDVAGAVLQTTLSLDRKVTNEG